MLVDGFVVSQASSDEMTLNSLGLAVAFSDVCKVARRIRGLVIPRKLLEGKILNGTITIINEVHRAGSGYAMQNESGSSAYDCKGVNYGTGCQKST